MMEVFALFFFFFFPCALVATLVWLKSRERLTRYRTQADLYTQTLEKGHSVTLPEGLFAEPEKRSNSLKAGLICIATGAGIALALWLMGYFIGNSELPNTKDISTIFTMFAFVGILPVMIGVAFLIIHFFERKRRAGEKKQ